MNLHNERTGIQSSDIEFKKTTKHDEDGKSSNDYLEFYDLSTIVTGAIRSNIMSSTENISYIFRINSYETTSPSYKHVMLRQRIRVNTIRLYHSSGMNQFSWLSFSKPLNGGICRFCVIFFQLDFQHENVFVTQAFTACKKAPLKQHNSKHYKSASLFVTQQPK